MAQAWSDGCTGGHGFPPFDRTPLGYDYIGQNVFSGNGKWYTNPVIDHVTIIGVWFGENANYAYNGTCLPRKICGSCLAGKMCGHYTQVGGVQVVITADIGGTPTWLVQTGREPHRVGAYKEGALQVWCKQGGCPTGLVLTRREPHRVGAYKEGSPYGWC